MIFFSLNQHVTVKTLYESYEKRKTRQIDSSKTLFIYFDGKLYLSVVSWWTESSQLKLFADALGEAECGERTVMHNGQKKSS